MAVELQILNSVERVLQKCERVLTTTPPDVLQKIVSDCEKWMAYYQKKMDSMGPARECVASKLKFLTVDKDYLKGRIPQTPSSPLKKYSMCVLKSKNEKNLHELAKILKQQGLGAEMVEGALHLPHHGDEVFAMRRVSTQFDPYFLSDKGRICFSISNFGGYESQKGIWEDTTGRAAAIADLVERSDRELPSTIPKPVSCHLSEELLEDTTTMFFDLFVKQDFKYVFVVECHSDFNAKRIIIDNMLAFPTFGVDTFLLEHIFDTQMPFIDEFYRTGKMPKPLAAYLAELDHRFNLVEPYTYTNLVVQARAANIRIFPSKLVLPTAQDLTSYANHTLPIGSKYSTTKQ